ncbi:MAG: DUF5606 domain-containing protein [Bacteroidota bacterium]
MNLDKIVAVSGGLNGIYKMAANRSNGLIVEDLDTGKRKFASVRRHQFTPLNSVGIYTDDGDTAEISEVFQRMLDQLEDNPPIPVKSSKDELSAYFTKVLPNHDEERVYPRDIRRVIKWFNYLNERDYFNAVAEEE